MASTAEPVIGKRGGKDLDQCGITSGFGEDEFGENGFAGPANRFEKPPKPDGNAGMSAPPQSGSRFARSEKGADGPGSGHQHEVSRPVGNPIGKCHRALILLDPRKSDVLRTRSDGIAALVRPMGEEMNQCLVLWLNREVEPLEEALQRRRSFCQNGHREPPSKWIACGTIFADAERCTMILIKFAGPAGVDG